MTLTRRGPWQPGEIAKVVATIEGLDQSNYDEPVRRLVQDIRAHTSTERDIGIIVPSDLAIEHELPRWIPAAVSLHLVHTDCESVAAVSRRMAELVSNTDHLEAASHNVLHVDPKVAAYLCASGSFVKGVNHEQTLTAAVEAAGAQTTVTTSGALAEALTALQVFRVCVITPYDEELTELLRIFLSQLDVTVLRPDCLGLCGGIWKVDYQTVVEQIIAADHPDAQAIFVSCTNLRTYDIIEPLEAMLGKPILTANQLTMWACLQRMGLSMPGPGRWLRTAFPAPQSRTVCGWAQDGYA